MSSLPHSSEQARWRELMDRHLLGIITGDESRELEAILARNREARADFRLRCNVDAALRQQAAGQGDRVAKPATQPKRIWLAPVLWSASAAFAILVAGVLWLRASAERTGDGVAVLSRSAGAEWQGEGHAAGAVLRPGMLQLKSGAVLVEFYSGARIVIEGPAKLNLISANEARLDEGRVNAHVPPQARGFTLNTDGMKVIDQGTDFGLVAGAGAPSEVHVFSGDVEINTTGRASHHLVTGEAVAMNAGNMQTMNAIRSAFMDEVTLIDRSNQRLQVWKAASTALDSDPAMLLHFTFDDATTRRDVRNHAARAEAESTGAIVGGAWTTGRWPGKGALGFSGESDRVRFTIAQPAHELTLLAWVRVDSLSHSQNALLVSDSEQPGSLRWHLTRNGELRLEIARDLGRSYSDWEAVNSRAFVKPDRWGQWLLLATTFDGKTIRHYANGELIGSGASFTPPSLNMGTAELANWRGDVKRNLFAAFDEFAVLSRAMNENELRRMFEAGKP